jgi:predicted O-methyltransferase YrrM
MNITLEYIGKKFNVDMNEPTVAIGQINRTMIAQMLGELGFTEGAEVGVAQGVYSKVLFDNIPNLKLFGIDVWTNYPGYQELADPDALYKEAKETLKDYNSYLIRKFSMEAVTYFADNSLDFVFIDGAHDFKNVACDIFEWSKKVKPNGIVFGHDYKFHHAFTQKFAGRPPRQRFAVDVKIVANAYREAKAIRPWIEIYSEIPDPTFGRDNPCWMFVRQKGDKI